MIFQKGKENLEVIKMEKTNKTKTLKLLALTGDCESLRTAVQAKADCIYFVITNFNMRST